MYVLKKISLSGLIFLLILTGCGSLEPFVKISVSETTGLSRDLEYVSIEIPFHVALQPSQILVAFDVNGGTSVPVQVLDTVWKGENSSLKIMFPVSIEENTTKTFELTAPANIGNTGPFGIQMSDDRSSVENQIYKATFSTTDNSRRGQINGMILKNFDDKLLKRGHVAMHWAPNFSKSDEIGYFNMEDLPSTSLNHVEKGFYQVEKIRSGRIEKHPEIFLEGKYTFFADLPYFISESTMTMEEEVSLNLLRNDEMTMDSLFTHVVYQKDNGKVARLQLYDAELDGLENNHISDDSNFVAFYNCNHGYGLASVRLEYDNTNSEGNQSPLFNPYTKISKSRGNGRYWNRVLIDSATTLPKGSRYHEKNAYLVFETGKKIPEERILYYAERLANPLSATLEN